MKYTTLQDQDCILVPFLTAQWDSQSIKPVTFLRSVTFYKHWLHFFKVYYDTKSSSNSKLSKLYFVDLKARFPYYQGESTIFDKGNFLYHTSDSYNLLNLRELYFHTLLFVASPRLCLVPASVHAHGWKGKRAKIATNKEWGEHPRQRRAL